MKRQMQEETCQELSEEDMLLLLLLLLPPRGVGTVAGEEARRPGGR